MTDAADQEFVPLTELEFDIDRDADELNRDDPAERLVIDDATIRLLRRDNRLGLARGAVARSASPDIPPGRSLIYIPLNFALQAHPECIYRWARIIVDLSPTNDAIIADMSPRGVTDVPVEIETTLGLGLSLSVLSKVVDVGAKPELARKRTVFFPDVAATGTGFRKAYWDFYPKGGSYLHADKELHLLVDVPQGEEVMAGVTVRAKVSFRGLPQLIPLLGRTGGAGKPDTVRLA